MKQQNKSVAGNQVPNILKFKVIVLLHLIFCIWVRLHCLTSILILCKRVDKTGADEMEQKWVYTSRRNENKSVKHIVHAQQLLCRPVTPKWVAYVCMSFSAESWEVYRMCRTTFHSSAPTWNMQPPSGAPIFYKISTHWKVSRSLHCVSVEKTGT